MLILASSVLLDLSTNGGFNMKATGITKQIDPLGRILFPKPIRNALNVSEGDTVEFFIGKGEVTIKKYELSCIFCGSHDELSIFENRKICKSCIEKIHKIDF